MNRSRPPLLRITLFAAVCISALAPTFPDPPGPGRAAGVEPSLRRAQEDPQAEPQSPFGEPLVVNGHRIPDIEIKRFLCYGRGYHALDSRRLGVLIKQERELRVFRTRAEICAARFDGKSYDTLTDDEKAEVDVSVVADLAHLEYDQKEYQRRLSEHADKFTENYPTLDLHVETRRSYGSVQWFEDQVRQTLEFDSLFFPGHPDGWPALTLEAIHASCPQFDLVEDYAEHYQWRLEEAEKSGEPIRREEEMLMGILRQSVMSALASLVEIRTQTAGLDPQDLMTVEGGGFKETLATEDVYQEMQGVFTPADIQDAKMFLALECVTREKLAAAGALKNRTEFVQEVYQLRRDLEASMFNLDFVALEACRFPSITSYIEHAYLLESFKGLIADQIEDTEDGSLPWGLQDHLPQANVVMGLGRCKAEVMLISAFDFPRYQWKENGWGLAEAKAHRVIQEIHDYMDYILAQDEHSRVALEEGRHYELPEDLVSFDEYWSNLLDVNSEFWDPPMSVTGKKPPAMALRNKGRFTSEFTTRNDFQRYLGESVYTEYLHDQSVTDKIFFELEPGTVGGPYRGVEGYYIIYLMGRQAPASPLDPHDDRNVQLLKDDYARARLQVFAHAALAEAEVSGL